MPAFGANIFCDFSVCHNIIILSQEILRGENVLHAIEKILMKNSGKSSIETGEEIPENFYRGVAEVLVFVYRLKAS